jgi:hypothetical protein
MVRTCRKERAMLFLCWGLKTTTSVNMDLAFIRITKEKMVELGSTLK